MYVASDFSGELDSFSGTTSRSATSSKEMTILPTCFDCAMRRNPSVICAAGMTSIGVIVKSPARKRSHTALKSSRMRSGCSVMIRSRSNAMRLRLRLNASIGRRTFSTMSRFPISMKRPSGATTERLLTRASPESEFSTTSTPRPEVSVITSSAKSSVREFRT